MSSSMGKRKISERVSGYEKRVRLEASIPHPEKYQSYDRESEDEYQNDDQGKSEDDSNLAETPNTPFSPPKIHPSNLKTIKCTVAGCTKTFNRPSRLANHLKAHNNERSFVCTYEGCDKSYFEQKHLSQHIKGSHTRERSYECTWERCTKSFLTATRLRRHIETHEGQNRFRCTGYASCSQTFRKHQTLQRHIRSEHLMLTPYPCTYIDPITLEHCDAGFDGAVGLRKHEDRVHGLPRFFCPSCTLPGYHLDGSAIHLGFTTDSQLQSHIKKEHAHCPFCDRKCSSQRELQKHIETQHSGKPLEERKTIPCTFEGCDKTFTKKNNRDVHIRTQHEGSRFICGSFDVSRIAEFASFDPEDACGKDFISKANLEDHIRTAHLCLPSRLNANRKKSAPNSEDEDEISDNGFEDEPQQKTKRNRGKKVKSAIDDFLGVSYVEDPRRNIPCLVAACPHLFIRDYDLQQHMRTKHGLLAPDIGTLGNDNEHRIGFASASEGFGFNDAYVGHPAGEQVDWGMQGQSLSNDSFWLGGINEELPSDQWAQDELEMSLLIGEAAQGLEFGDLQ